MNANKITGDYLLFIFNHLFFAFWPPFKRFFHAYSSYSLSFKRVEKEGGKTIKNTWQADIDRVDPRVSELDYLMFSSRAVFLWKWKGAVPPPHWLNSPFSILCLRGKRGDSGFRSVELPCPWSSWAPVAPDVSNCSTCCWPQYWTWMFDWNRFLVASTLSFYCFHPLPANRIRICSARLNQNECVLIVGNKLRCASMLLKSCLIICGGNAPWHYMTKALVYLRARSQCTIHETEVNNDGSSKQLPYNIKTKSWTSESMAAQQVTQVSGRSRRCWVMSWCFGYTI